MNSLTYKLAGIFLVIALIPLIIGINGTLSLKTAENALTENNRALQGLNELLASAGASLSENVRLQANANHASGQIARAQEDTSESLRDMGNAMLPRAFAISQIRYALSEAASAERALLLALNMRHLVGEDLDAARATQRDNIANAIDAMAKSRQTYLSLAGDGEDETAWREFEAALQNWHANHDEFMKHIEELDFLVEDLIRGGPLFATTSRKAYDTLFLTGKSVRQECENRIAALNRTLTATSGANVKKAMESQAVTRTLVEELGRESDAAAAQANSLLAQFETARTAATAAGLRAQEALNTTSRRFWFMAVFSIIGVIAAVIVGLIQSWRITKPIRSMVVHISRLASGDVGLDVPDNDCARRDEIGQLARGFRELIHSSREEIEMANAMANGDYTTRITMRSQSDELGRALGTMINVTNETLARVSKAIDRVGDGAASVSEASRSLSQGAQTSASALEEISQTVNEVDRQAQDNAAHAREANQLATASRDAAKRGYSAVTELVSAMREIQESGKKIASVAKLIDDIAFQTNLLALNAAVEAARAGRQGRGFSVVADEVRSLSGRSAKAARETSEMVTAMTERMEVGSQLAIRTDHEFRDIVEATDQVAKLFDEIAEASSAQSTAMAQIAQGVNQIDTVVQENTSNASLTATSSLTLARQAEELRRMVSRFRLFANTAPGQRGCPSAPHRMALPDERADQRLLSAPDRE